MNNLSSPATPLAVSVHGLRFSYISGGAGKTVLDVSELEIAQGEKVFLYGPSGCGKTTLLGVLAGILPASAGQVKVLGHAFDSISGRARDAVRGTEIGYIFQMFNLIPYLNVYENIVLPCRLRPKRLAGVGSAQADLKKSAHELARALGIEALLTQPVTALSVGQQQRVAAARALLGRPKLIIADEPTSALDSEHREHFLKLLFEQCTAQGSTLVFVSHDRQLMPLFERTVSLPELNRAARG